MRRFDAIVSRIPIDRGWSADRKFRAVTAEGTVYFLRIASMDREPRCRAQFRNMCRVRDLGVPMSEPVEFGLCDEGCYTLLSWIEGRDAEQVLPTLSGRNQYAYGRKAGQMLRTIHTLPAPEDPEPWSVRFGGKVEKRLAAYDACPVKFDDGGALMAYVRENLHLTLDRPQTYCHGDFHCGNLMFDETMTLRVVDFDREDAADPWYEFNRIIWDGRAAPEYARGMLDGYFDGRVPGEFWSLMALYLCQNMISSLPWSQDFGAEEQRIAQENGARVLEWYDDMKTVVPSWYYKSEDSR